MEKLQSYLQVYLVEYSDGMSISQEFFKCERKIFFNKEKMLKWLKDNHVYNITIRTVNIEDVDYMEYRLRGTNNTEDNKYVKYEDVLEILNMIDERDKYQSWCLTYEEHNEIVEEKIKELKNSVITR